MARTLVAESRSRETRAGLLEAGLRAADDLGVRGLSVNAIVAEAARSKGAFFHHFPDRESYLVELHRRVHDEMETEMRELGEGLPPGRGRLEIVAQVYLDTFLRRRGVRAFLFEARGEPAIKREIARRNVRGSGILEEDFEALGWANPKQVARLWIAALAEVGVIELDLGRRKNRARRALIDLAAGPPTARA